MPNEFLPEAEDSKLIIPIGHWVIQKALYDFYYWRANLAIEPEITMSVNLSRKQLLDPKLPSIVKETLLNSHIPAEYIAFEITENVIVEDDLQILETLSSLKNLGVHLHIDDFGTGYSSLHILPTYPIDTIQVDKSFIRNIPKSTKDYEIVRLMIELGPSLKIGVIAEGIEAPHEFVELKSMHCTQVQGDYFSKPLPQNAIGLLLEKMTKKKEGMSKIDHKKLFSGAK
ncbi:MAG: hypothetical protein A2Z14_02315 [Chloroflexi bacterium RBG_16_48_8]|nr:MAG: hypothetical protein A2Z14_02315 [Chloroflexi bacterium RBG_16_48_8]